VWAAVVVARQEQALDRTGHRRACLAMQVLTDGRPVRCMVMGRQPARVVRDDGRNGR